MNHFFSSWPAIFVFLSILISPSAAQSDADSSKLSLKALSFRGIGPAINGGRIADIALHPDNENVWYVAVGSGHLWKTTNAGTTWKPIFDGQDVYSIGQVAIDPSQPHIIWVGTGEDEIGRASCRERV